MVWEWLRPRYRSLSSGGKRGHAGVMEEKVEAGRGSVLLEGEGDRGLFIREE